MGMVGRYLTRRDEANRRRNAEKGRTEFEQEYWNWATQYFRLKIDGGMAPADAVVEAHFSAYTRTWNAMASRGAVPRPWRAPHAYDSSEGMEAFRALATWSGVDPDDVVAALNKHGRWGGMSWELIRERELMPSMSGDGPTILSTGQSDYRLTRVPECPKCASDLLIVEHRPASTDPGLELTWSRTFRTCSQGCQLTVENFPNG